MSHDSADLVAKARAQLGLSRELQQERRIPPDPTRGGAPGHPYHYRIQQLQKAADGEDIDVSDSSIYRWNIRPAPYRITGNSQRSQVVGIDMFNLVFFVITRPDATLEEMAVDIYNCGGELFSVSAISCRLQDLDITKKKASVEAYQAQREDVQFRLLFFFDSPPPIGINGVPRFKLIDFNEFGITLEQCNRTGGW